MTTEAVTLSADEVERVRQWFDAVDDLDQSNQRYLDKEDCRIAIKLYNACKMRVPNKLRDGAQ